MTRYQPVVLGLILATGTPAATLADATIEIAAPEQGDSTILIKGGKVRMSAPGQGDNYTIFDADRQTMTRVSAEQRRYMVVDEQVMKQQAERMRAAMERMRERMQGAPPGEGPAQPYGRGGPGMGPGAGTPPEPPQVRASDRTDRVAGVPCRIHDLVQGGEKVGQLCVARDQDLGLAAEDRKALDAMKEYSRRMAEQMRSSMGPTPGGGPMPAGGPFADVEGTPIRVVMQNPQGGGLQTVMQLKRVDTGSLPKDLFTVPAGYEQIDPLAGPGR